jgi:3-methyladenine DNA glycosylase AlkD
MRSEELIAELRRQANPANVEGMTRYGISPVGTLGVSMPVVRSLARDAKRATGRDSGARHALAEELWSSGVHEARILAAHVDVPSLVSDSQMDRWVADVDSWDVCDQLCGILFDKTPLAWDKAVEWAGREPEFTKRAGFVLMTQLAVHDKSAADERFTPFLPLIEREANDGRPYVKKAVNWALRQIGKRDAALHKLAIDTAERIIAEQSESPSARWVARDALRELRSDAVLARLAARRPA